MPKRHAIALLAAVGLSFNCATCEPITPGEVGDECETADDCKSGLICVDGKCAVVTADAGPTDAAMGDGQVSDRAGTDQVGIDQSGTDAWLPDSSVPDHPGQDQGPLDQGQVDHSQPDSSGIDQGGPRDSGRRDSSGRDRAHQDRPWQRDGWSMDYGSRDWSFPDRIFIDGGVAFDIGVIGYDGGSEPGVICGGQTCPAGQHCCISFSYPYPVYNCLNSCPGGVLADLQCDDPGDCPGECCATGTNTSCTQAGQCLLNPDGGSTSNVLVCANAADCHGHYMANCCTSANFAMLGIDLGWCQTTSCE
ncbi:MAG: hypothetical protein JXR83_20330 [Deltaproteobacteria bacterium]|nr:hypothetical protein [Deltaproteobacteria bacterium]